jgi:hypothetical protein
MGCGKGSEKKKIGGQRKKFNILANLPMYQASPMTPPHPAWVFSETRAIFFKQSAVNRKSSGI